MSLTNADIEALIPFTDKGGAIPYWNRADLLWFARAIERKLAAQAPAPAPEASAQELVDNMCRLGVWWTHSRSKFTTPRQAAFAAWNEAFRTACQAPAVAHTQAAQDVLAERHRQITAEGWTPRHDDQHADGSLALASACYACNAATWAHRAPSIPADAYTKFSEPGFRWPWHFKWWKPKSQRQDLVRAAALILAEIERLDRAAMAQGGQKP